MIAIYQKFNPAKVVDVPMLLSKYKGKEMEMLGKLEAKYAPVPVFVNGVQIHPAPPAQQVPTTLLEQLSMTTPMPLPLAAASFPTAPAPVPFLQPAAAPQRAMPAGWRPGMALPSGQRDTNVSAVRPPADPFGDLVNLKKS
jgi:hypothetical protein